MTDPIISLLVLLTALSGVFAILGAAEKLQIWLEDRRMNRDVLPPPQRAANRDYYAERQEVRRGRVA